MDKRNEKWGERKEIETKKRKEELWEVGTLDEAIFVSSGSNRAKIAKKS